MEQKKNKRKHFSVSEVRLSRRGVTFLFCLLLSVFFWLVMNLSRRYEETFYFPVKYIHLPNDKVLSAPLPVGIEAEIKTNGFNLLLFKYWKQRDTLVFDVSEARRIRTNHYYILPARRSESIAQQVGARTDVVKVFPDTVYFSFEKK